jgi:hypothetical protein
LTKRFPLDNKYKHDIRVEKRNINDLHTRMNDNIRENKIIASGSLGNEHAWVDESGASVRRADSHEYFVELADAAKEMPESSADVGEKLRFRKKKIPAVVLMR